MTSLILLNHLVPDIDILKNAIKVPYVESEHLVSDIIDSEPGTHELDQNIVNNISNLDSSITTIAVLYENIAMIPIGFEALCSSLPQHIKTIDLLTCNLNDEESIKTLKTLESRYNKIIRYSVDLTGHEDSMGNWILESHNVSVRNIYFNNMITEWKHVLIYIRYNGYYYYRMWDSIYDVNHNELTYSSDIQRESIHSAKMRTDISTLKTYTLYGYYGTISGIYIPPNITNWEQRSLYRDRNASCTTFVVDSNVFSMVSSPTWDRHAGPFAYNYFNSVASEKTIFILWKDIPGRSEPYVSNIYHSGTTYTNYNKSNLVFVRLRTDAPPVYTMEVRKNNTIPLPQHLEDRHFSFSDFSGIDFSHTSFKNSILFSVNLSNANLSGADLSNADLTKANLNGADLNNADLTNANLNGADFTDVNIEAIGTKGPIQGSPITPQGWIVRNDYFTELIIGPGADLSGLDLSRTHFSGVKTGPLDGSAPSSLPSGYTFVSGTNEQWIIGPNVDLSGAVLTGANLSNVDLSGANLTGANLSNVDLSGAKTGPFIGDVPLSLPTGYDFIFGTHEQWIIGPGIDLSGADLRGMDLSNLNLSGADLSGAKTWPLLGTAPSLPVGYVFLMGWYEKGIIGPNVNLDGADLYGADLSDAKTWPLLGTAPSSLPDGYEFVSGTNETGIIGSGVNLDGLDLSGMNLSNIDFFNIKTGPLVGTAPTLSNEYTFVSGTNEKWIIGYGVDLGGADLSGANVSDVIFSGVNLNGVKTSSLIGSAPSSLPDGYDFVSGTSESCIIGPGVDLSGADLRGMNFLNLNLTSVILSGAKTWPLNVTGPSLPAGYTFVSGTNEKGIIGPSADLTGADLRGADLRGADLSSVNLTGTDLRGIDLSNVDLSNINLSGVKTDPLSETILSSIPSGYYYVSGTNEHWIIEPNANLSGADLSGIDLSAVDLSDVDFTGVKSGPLNGEAPISLPDGYDFVSGTNQKWIIGPGVDLGGANLSGMNLNNIVLTSAKTGPLVDSSPSSLPDDYKFIRGTNENWIIGPDADLTGADLTGADLTGADLTKANLSDAILYGAKTGSLVGSLPTSLPSGYTFQIYSSAWIIGPYVDLSDADLSGFNFNIRDLRKSGPLVGSAPSSLHSKYKFVSGTHEKWIIGPYVDLSGADLSNMDLSDISFSQSNLTGANLTGANLTDATLNTGTTLIGVKAGPLVGSAPQFLSVDSYNFVSGTNETWIVGPDVDLSGADLSGMNLSNINLSGVNLSGAKTWLLNGSAPTSLPAGYEFVSGSNETGIIGPGVDLSGADLSGVIITGAKTGPLIGDAPTSLPDGYDFISVTHEQWIVGPNVDLSGADLRGMDLSNATLSGVKSGPLVGSAPSSLPSGYEFISGTHEHWIIGQGVDLSGADLRGMDLDSVDLDGTNLSGVKTDPLPETISSSLPSGYDFISGTNENWIIGHGVDLSGVDLSGMNLTGVDLSDVDFTGVKSGPLVGSEPISLPSGYDFVSGTHEQWIIGPNVNLDGADLSDADLSGADLTGVDLSGTDLTGVKTGPLVGSAPILPDTYKYKNMNNEKWIIGPDVILDGANLSGTDLSGLNLSNINLSNVNLSNTYGQIKGIPLSSNFKLFNKFLISNSDSGINIFRKLHITTVTNYTNILEYISDNQDLSNKIVMNITANLSSNNTINNTKFINVIFDQQSIQYLQNKSVALLNCNLQQ